MNREFLRAQAAPPELRKVLVGRAGVRARLFAVPATAVDAPVGPRVQTLSGGAPASGRVVLG